MSSKIFTAFLGIISLSVGIFIAVANPVGTSARPAPNLINAPISSDNKIIDYSKQSFINTPETNRLYVTLNDGFSTYPPSLICIDGIPVLESGSLLFAASASGSGLFYVGSLLDPATGPHSVWIPYYSGDCGNHLPAESSFQVSLNPDESLIVNAVILDRGNGTTPIVTETPKPKTEAPKNNDTPQTVQEPVTNRGEVAGVRDSVQPDFIVYGLKAVYIASGKPILLDAKLDIARTSVFSNRSFNFSLSKVTRIDKSLTDLTCELITSDSKNQAVATSKLDNNGKCDITWTPGSKAKKGRITSFIRIVDQTRSHTYVTASFSLVIK
jgi:hypothetical protein